MKGCCTEETLALYVEADLPETQMEKVSTHWWTARMRATVVAELTETQSVFKSIRQDIAPASIHARVREQVMNEVMRTPSGWSLRLERMLCGIRWRYAILWCRADGDRRSDVLGIPSRRTAKQALQMSTSRRIVLRYLSHRKI
jgi:anti-sigma factor RsiW